MYKNFEWPIPAYFELVPGTTLAEHEEAVVVMRDGHHASGRLIRFLPENGVIEFCPAHGRANLELTLDDFHDLRLTRPVLLRRRASVLADHAGDASERQPFHVELVNGEVLEGETLGFEVHRVGLFLYMVMVESAVLRCFIPAPAIRSQQVGRPIGEILMQTHSLTPQQIDAGLEQQKALRDQKLGDFLTEQRIISREELGRALERQRSMPMVRLGEALLQLKAIDEDQLDQALAHQKENRSKPLGEILIELGFIGESDLRRALSQKLGIPFVDLSNFPVDPGVLKALPEGLIREFNLMPLCMDGAALVVAMENPLDPAPRDRVRFVTGLNLVPVMATRADVSATISTYFGALSAEAAVEDLASQLGAEIAPQQEDEIQVTESDSTLVRLVNKVILDAYNGGASDIHIETNPGRKNTLVRFRKDGVLEEYLQVPASFRAALVSRIKIMANLDISEHRKGQDGRINFQNFGPAKIELRVATVPTLGGLEDVVMRILAAGEPLPLAKLGMRPQVLEALKNLTQKSFGLLLVCGPTGSGKTTTLHSVLSHINTPERKIWTAEDPIEISQPGLRQVQMNVKAGWTFATAMRSFLRADPDVIMVGEMRDEETAKMGVEASLTGHLVMSTLHTNSAPESVVRLLQMGMDPFNFGDSLAGILAQRLTRRLCATCKTSAPASEGQLIELAAEYCQDSPLDPAAVVAEWKVARSEIHLATAHGCGECRNTGYKGRLGIHELLVNTPTVRDLIQHRANASEIRQAAVRGGMRTLKQDGIEKCLDGLTDIHEIRAACN